MRCHGDICTLLRLYIVRNCHLCDAKKGEPSKARGAETCTDDDEKHIYTGRPCAGGRGKCQSQSFVSFAKCAQRRQYDAIGGVDATRRRSGPSIYPATSTQCDIDISRRVKRRRLSNSRCRFAIFRNVAQFTSRAASRQSCKSDAHEVVRTNRRLYR